MPAFRRRRLATLVIVACLVATSGCGRAHLRRYEAGVSANRAALQGVRLGMTKREVAAVMGTGDVVRYGKIRLTDPWRSEAFLTADGKRVEILYYVTDGYQWKRFSEQRVLTPIALENDRVVGWGWRFVESNRASYFPARTPAPPAAGAELAEPDGGKS